MFIKIYNSQTKAPHRFDSKAPIEASGVWSHSSCPYRQHGRTPDTRDRNSGMADSGKQVAILKSTLLLSSFPVLLVLLLLPLPVVHGSPVLPDSIHFCAVDEYEQPLLGRSRPAAKRQAELNAGDPRTVRMIYFLPNDRPFRREIVDSMKVVIRQVQTFYAKQMEAHGHGNRTFRFETDAKGDPSVHRVNGQLAGRVYNETRARLIDEIGGRFDLDANIYLICADVYNFGGFGNRRGRKGGTAFVGPPTLYHWAGHELGHVFGLRHDFSDGSYYMSYGPGRDSLSACHAAFLAVHPYFNSSVPIADGPPPTLNLLSPRVYPEKSSSVAVRLSVSASASLHQIIYLIDGPQGLEVKACLNMAGDRDTVVEFEYDGVIPSTDRDDHYSHFLYRTSLSDPARHPISVLAVDADGNVGATSFVIEEISPDSFATLEGHTDLVSSVAFSPDSATLASAARDGVVLWDVETRKEVARLAGPSRSVSFSREGKVLAMGSLRSTKLWDPASRETTATIDEPGRFLRSMVLSSDGTTLATGGSAGKIKLWDVTTRENTATLKGHIGGVNSVVFSRDGATLASGSEDGTVKLWHVASQENTATLEKHTDFVQSVAISPDGKLLASASSDGTALLWNIEGRRYIAIVGRSQRDITSVAFSPDGSLLAVSTLESSESMGSTVRLWDTVKHERIAAFGHRDVIWTVAISPDGKLLAAGSAGGAIALWDIAQYLAPSVRNPDFDGDGTVGFGDFLLFAATFGQSQGDAGYDSRFDLDGNGAIGFSDFLILAGAFGRSTT